MQPKDIADMLLKIADSINFLWNFYAFGTIAIVSWLLSLKRNLNWQLKLLLSLGFLCFVTMNLTALLRSYTFADSLRLELQANIDQSTFKTQGLYELTKGLSFSRQIWIAWGIHIFVDSGVLVIVWSNRVRSFFFGRHKTET